MPGPNADANRIFYEPSSVGRIPEAGDHGAVARR